MKKSLLTFLALLYFGSPAIIGQTQYDLSLSDATYSVNQDTLCLQLNISFDALGKLGSANLVLEYDPTSLGDPFIDIWPGLDSSLYLGKEIRLMETGKSSMNLELGSINLGISVPDGSLAILYLSKVCFDVLDPNGDFSVDWYREAYKGTVVYLDDETTLLSPGLLSGYEPPAAFPVEWLDFQVSQADNEVKLDWTTASEINNDGFYVGRSLDGVVFERLDFVPSKGNSPVGHTYEWLDSEAMYELGENRQLFYRLTQIDLDGTVTNSDIRTLRLEMDGLSLVKVYPLPTPAPGNLRVELKTKDASTIDLSLVNALGQVMDTQLYAFYDAGKHEIMFPLGDIPPGIYYLRFSELEATYHFVQILVY